MKIKILVLALLGICISKTSVIGGPTPNVPPAKTAAGEALERANQKFKLLARDKNLFVMAIVWSRLTHQKNQDGLTHFFYREPVTGQHLNIGLAGERDEWSWFVTFARKKSGRGDDSFITLQVRENGDVNLLNPSH